MQKQKQKCKKNEKKLLKLEYYRKKYGFTQEEFASVLGIKQESYSAKVRGIAAITFDQMKELQMVLNNRSLVQDGIHLTLDEIFLN